MIDSLTLTILAPVSYTHIPVTVLIRDLGYGTNAEILDLFGEEPKLLASFGKDTSDNYQDGLLELYKKIRPGEPLSVDLSLIHI